MGCPAGAASLGAARKGADTVSRRARLRPTGRSRAEDRRGVRSTVDLNDLRHLAVRRDPGVLGRHGPYDVSGRT